MAGELRVGLIGYGYAGCTFHAPVITSVPELKLTKVVERKGTLSKMRYPWVKVVDDACDLYEDPDIDLIVVATPSMDHFTFTRAALLAGKHVVVEKPFTSTSAEADELIALAKRQGKVLSVFHNRRWDGDFLTIKELLRQGRLGQLMECEFRWDGFNPEVSGNWRDAAGPGTGVWYDLGVHFLDQALCLFGIPESIEADIQTQRKGGAAPDYFDVTLRYPDHLKVVLKSSRFVRIPTPRYSLHGTLGSYVKYGTDPQESALIAGHTPATISDWGMEPSELWGKIRTSINGIHFEGTIETFPGNYTHYYQNVYDHIVGRSELEVKAEEARTGIRIVELALKSCAEGRAITINEELEG
ncbi:oxidoreductase [Bacillus sp. FJAT-28004]|uniref:oxidoreductase n=1 Tax=Bacillus sp. FJAT-28004 TaxID=1679165 RepID=UPI0006B49DB7|nr:oxidoreductase [Bacillus sp. FJAT-28004]